MPRVTATGREAAGRRLSSRRHPLIETYRMLARDRDPAASTILLDGLHLVQDARRARISIRHAAFSQSSLRNPAVAAEAAILRKARVDVVEVSDSVAAALSPVRTPSGIVAIAERPTMTLDRLLDAPAALIVVAVDVQDPGNLGAIVRACEAGGATGVITAGVSADPFSWKALRGSMGSSLRLPVMLIRDAAGLVASCRRRGMQIVAMAARGGRSFFDLDWTRPTVAFLGNEGGGLPAEVVNQADVLLTIPMREPVESLNVSVAAGVLVYEAFRQRSNGT